MRTTVSLIGCGRIGHLLENDPLRNKPCTHLGGMQKARLRVIGGSDLDAARLASFGKSASLHGSRLFTDYRDLLREPSDIVTIATPTPAHAKISIAAAESGARVIICEKPIASSLSDARKMCDSARANNAVLMINHERRYDPRYRAVQRALKKGAIGELRSVRGVLPARGFLRELPLSFGGGVFLHDGTHLIDIISFFAGPFTAIGGRFNRLSPHSTFEDQACGYGITKNGVPVTFDVGGDTRYFSFGLTLQGSKGTIEIGNGYQRLYQTSPSKLYTNFFDLAERSFPSFSNTNCFTELYREAANIAQGKTTAPCSSGDDGYHALEVIHGFYLASHTHKEVAVPLTKNVNLKKVFAHKKAIRL